MNSKEKAAAIEAAVSAKRGKHVRITCPLCPYIVGKVDRRSSCSVNTISGSYKCFRCGSYGRFKAGLMQEPVEEKTQAAGLPPEFVQLGSPSWRGISLQPAEDYYETRRVYDAALDIGAGAACTGFYGGRIIVPVKDWDGVLRTFVARSWGPAPLAYRYPRGERGSIMFNEAVLLEDTSTPVMVVEGVLDAMVDGLWPNAVASLGKPKPSQLFALASISRPVALVPDGDAWQEAVSQALLLHALGKQVGVVKLPPRIDPDEIDSRVLNAAARIAVLKGFVELENRWIRKPRITQVPCSGLSSAPM